MQLLAFTGPGRWEPGRLRLRIFAGAGASHPIKIAKDAGQPSGDRGAPAAQAYLVAQAEQQDQAERPECDPR
jgi:hypothetical protein